MVHSLKTSGAAQADTRIAGHHEDHGAESYPVRSHFVFVTDLGIPKQWAALFFNEPEAVSLVFLVLR